MMMVQCERDRCSDDGGLSLDVIMRLSIVLTADFSNDCKRSVLKGRPRRSRSIAEIPGSAGCQN